VVRSRLTLTSRARLHSPISAVLNVSVLALVTQFAVQRHFLRAAVTDGIFKHDAGGMRASVLHGVLVETRDFALDRVRHVNVHVDVVLNGCLVVLSRLHRLLDATC
jgi:hypothetical protein